MKYNLIFLLAAIALVVAACESPVASSKDDTLSLVFATTMDDSGIDKDIKDFFGDKITELSDESIEIEFFMAGQLGGEREALEQMNMGEIDLGYSVLQAELYYPEYNAISIPFLFEDLDSMREFMDGEVGDEIKRISREKGGIIPMGLHGYGARWTTSNVPFSNIEELQGLKIRMPEIEWWVNVWAELGALPTPIAATEIVTALQTGTVDAQENFLTNIAGRQMWDYQKYLMKTEHIQLFQQWVISEDTWENKLTQEQQEIVAQAIDETLAYADEIVSESNEAFLEEIEANGMEIVYVDQEELREKAQPAIEKITQNELAPDVYEEVQKIMGD
ncbi:TRAP transporter substrate-binding protein [Oceanobacillus saliphilus]|uniref:TRAP transporter substrate-binding protein n=1 Tax=Oceanobacillus saliphilus TaxID=2925834 RepID=UPI00201D9E7F|nr:TRAP transporter substrate-binding protein [Oceanobacillus saliphilus]